MPSALSIFPSRASAPPQGANRVSPRAVAMLNEMRRAALRCRTAPYQDFAQACAHLTPGEGVPRAAHVETLIRGGSHVLGKALRFYRPGEAELSTDEIWLARIFDALYTADEASFQFLLRSRVHRSEQRNMAFLLRSIAAAPRTS